MTKYLVFVSPYYMGSDECFDTLIEAKEYYDKCILECKRYNNEGQVFLCEVKDMATIKNPRKLSKAGIYESAAIRYSQHSEQLISSKSSKEAKLLQKLDLRLKALGYIKVEDEEDDED